MADAQGPNMSREWNLEFGNRLLGIIREERTKTMVEIGSTVKWSGADPDRPEENVTYTVVGVGNVNTDYDYIVERNGRRNYVRASEIELI